MCAYLYIYIYIYICIHTCMYIYIYMYIIYTHIHVTPSPSLSLSIYIYIYIQVEHAVKPELWISDETDLHPQNICRSLGTKRYAHIEVLVTFLLVNFLGFLVITRYPTMRFWRKLVEILPISLPELSKPSRTSENSRKTKILETKNFRETEKN